MSCKDIQGIQGSSCTKSIAGIKNVWIFPFEDISEYLYTSDYLHKVTGYSAVTLPTLYTPNKTSSEYKGSKSLTDYRFYDHTLSLTFSKMEASKREELQKLESMELTVIFQDLNNTCWVIGQDLPAQLTTVKVGSGVKGGVSNYELTISSKEKQHIREIECPSDSCFASFKGVELRRTTIEVTTASLLTWQVFEAAADTQVISYTSPSPLDPVNWGTPAVLAADLYQLSLLFNQVGTPLIVGSTLTGSYNGGTDTATIIIESPDTSYGAFKVDNVVFAGQISVTLNLTTILSPLVANPTTTILVEDSVGTLYSGGYSTTVAASGVSGITNDSLIKVTTLYPFGTTFTMSLPTLGCTSLSYEYVFENTLSPCTLSTAFEFFKGEECEIDIPYVSGHVDVPRFQNINVNVFGDMFQLYYDHNDWHDSLPTFEIDLVNILNQVSTVIDTSSITFTDNGTSVSVRFKVFGIVPEQVNPFFKPYVRGFDQPVFNNTGWTESRVLNLDTAGPYPSILTHTDEYSNVIKGENLVNITSNLTYGLGNTVLTNNTSIDNVGLIWGFDGTQPYNEQSIITSSVDALECLAPSLISVFEQCYTGRDSVTNHNYLVLSLDTTGGSIDLGTTFDLTTALGTVSLTMPSVTPLDNIHYLTNALNAQKGIQVLHMDFSTLERSYRIHLKVVSTTSIISFKETTNSRLFALSALNPIYTNTLATKINPYIKLNYSPPTLSISSPTGDKDLMQGEWQEQFNSFKAVTVTWNQAADDITLLKEHTAASTLATEYIVSLHEVYPTTTNSKLTMTLSAGVASVVIPGIAAALISNGSNVASINYISYTSIVNERYVGDYDLTIAADVETFNESYRTPIMWGTMDYLEYIGSGVTVTDPTITSTTCVTACCAVGVAPDVTNIVPTLTFNGTNFEYDTNVQAIAPIDCEIRTIVVNLTKILGGDPDVLNSPQTLISSGCVGGKWEFDSLDPFEFSASPTGITYDIEYVFKDIFGTILYSFNSTVVL